MAQTDTRVIPPPPPHTVDSQSPNSADHLTQAKQDETDPERAFDPTTGQNLYWDCNKKTWIDAKTGKPVPGGFEGRRASDGEVIPPPPPHTVDSQSPNSADHLTQAKQDETDPERAFDPTTGQNLHWDRDKKTWIDSKTGKAIPGGFKGRRTNKPCPPPTSKTTDGLKTASVPARFELGLGYSYMHPADEVVKDLNGFNVSGFYNVNSWLAVGGEFSGLYGTDTKDFTGGSVKTSLDRYLYLFGPQVTLHPCERVKVFGRVLVGGVHDRNEVSFPGGSMRSSADAFAMAVGVGVDVQVTRCFSVGPSFDYVPTHFTSPTGDNWQNNWRVGVVGKISF